jgi:ankyrin repeat protein
MCGTDVVLPIKTRETSHQPQNNFIIVLLEKGADTQIRNRAGRKALFYAKTSEAMNGTEALRRLEEINAAEEKESRKTSFVELCGSGTLQEIEEAIRDGTDVNEKNSQGFSALMIAIIENQDIETIALLIKNGADVNHSDNYHWPVLAWAASGYSNPDVISLLVKNGADIHAKGLNGYTILMCAAEDNTNPEMITALIQNGADVNAVNNYGYTALGIAVESQISQNMKVLTTLLQNGAYWRKPSQ